MMDGITRKNNPSNRAMAIPSLICSHHSDSLHEPLSTKSEDMNESLRGIVWQITGEDFLQHHHHHQEEIFHVDSSHSLLPLPLSTTTTSSCDQEIIRKFPTFNSSSYSFHNKRTETERRHCSLPKLGKKAKLDYAEPTSISFRGEDSEEVDGEAIAQVKEIVYIAAALRPVMLGAEEVVEKPRRKNLKISSDPQTTAARHRRERISNRLRVLQRLVPGGGKMDTASMLDEAANYLKFLKAQVTAFENLGHGHMKSGGVNYDHGILPFPVAFSF